MSRVPSPNSHISGHYEAHMSPRGMLQVVNNMILYFANAASQRHLLKQRTDATCITRRHNERQHKV